MGTNYYAIPKATTELKDQLKKLIDEGDFKTVKQLMPSKIHIGKSSMGWQFCFNHNSWQYFEKSKESLEVFLLACTIHDEYGQDVSNFEFWGMVDIKRNFKPEIEYGTIEFGLNFSNSTNFC